MSEFTSPLTVDGVPVGGYGIPTTFGNYFYVDADDGDDANDGKTMKTARATILSAYNSTTSNNHDVIVLSANSGHTLDDELIVAKNRVHFVGLGQGSRYMGQRTRITMGVTTGSAIAAINNRGVGNTFFNLKITSADTLSTSIFCVAEQGEFAQWTNCWFEKNTDLNVAGAAEVLMVGDTPYFKNCTFGNGIYTVAAARQNWLMTRGSSQTSNVARDVIAEECIFMSRCNDTAFVNVRCTNNDVERLFLFKNCTFVAVKTSPAAQADVFGIAVALADARAILQGDTLVDNIAEVASTAGVFSNGSLGTPHDDGAITLAVT